MWLKIVLGINLFALFFWVFVWLGTESLVRRLMHRTFDSMDAAARQRVHENRKLLVLLQQKKGFLHKVEQRLVYSGLTAKYRFLTPELWILFQLALSAAGYFVTLMVGRSFPKALAVLVGIQVLREIVLGVMMTRNYRAVNDNLMKFLDFLGNYSITAGEVTGILNQISRYLEEPLRSVLDECYYEAQLSGDANLALLSMAEKIEHPRFKELVRNMEISLRYSADFSRLVQSSKRAVREHMRTRQERKALVNEALVNMLILLGMSAVILFMVEQLIGVPMRLLMLKTLPGQICLAVLIVIFALLYRQIRNLDR